MWAWWPLWAPSLSLSAAQHREQSGAWGFHRVVELSLIGCDWLPRWSPVQAM